MVQDRAQIQTRFRDMTRDDRAAFVEDLKTRRGGFTAEALAEIGINWPPAPGWRKRFVDGAAYGRHGGAVTVKSKKAERRRKRKRRAKQRRPSELSHKRKTNF